eukprot:TRINITY_DN15593_c0_g1_i1.p1 TRINITY_DN15593_c0_g1~~TRINITY_DN15593_c0_g1_i1.p1  ORF type:complete len:957 (-),score=263.74 TRINITY_DN15593_c0_g1_i1:87-2957(-)
MSPKSQSARTFRCSITTTVSMAAESTRVTVGVRVRPKLESLGEKYDMQLIRKLDDETIMAIGYTQGMVDPKSDKPYQIDYAFDESSTQTEIYERAAQGFVDATLKGINATIFAYGQTGTGKTYTIGELPDVVDAASPVTDDSGIIIRAISDIFRYKGLQKKIIVRLYVSYIEIYNESINDLLNPGKEGENLQLRESGDDTQIQNLTVYEVTKIAQVYDIMRKGQAARSTSKTNMNERSSRSHAVFMLTLEQWDGDKMAVSSTLTLVDLAGSERIKKSKVEGERLKEAQAINKSLSALGNVVNSMFYERSHVPYRDSKLTRMLKNSFMGNCKTLLLATVAPTAGCYDESLSTLRFADRIKQIKPKGKGFQSHELELENLALKKENDELSAELRIAIECFQYKMHLDKFQAADPKWDEIVTKVLEKARTTRDAELKKREEDAKAKLEKSVQVANDKTRVQIEQQFAKKGEELEKQYGTKITALEAQIASLQSDKDSSLQRGNDLQQQRDERERALAEANSQVADLKQQHATQTLLLQNEISSLQSELSALRSDKDSAVRSASDAQQQRQDRESSLAAALQQAQDNMSEMRQQHTAALSTAHAEISALKAQIATLQADVSSAQTAAEEARSTAVPSPATPNTAVVAAASPSAAASSGDVENLKMVAQLRAQVTTLKSENAALQARLQEMQDYPSPQGGLGSPYEQSTPQSPTSNGGDSVDEDTYEVDARQLTQQVVRYLQNGANLLKHGRQGKPHPRFFYITENRREIVWKESDRRGAAKSVELKHVSKCILGQHSEVFKRQKTPPSKQELDCSFSLHYLESGSMRTLDVVADNQTEWEAWVMALSALLEASQPEYGQQMDVSKMPHYEQLDADEKVLCSRYHVTPVDYLAIRSKASTEYAYMGENMIMAIRGVWSDEHIDYFRASKLYDFFSQKKIITSKPFQASQAAADIDDIKPEV